MNLYVKCPLPPLDASQNAEYESYLGYIALEAKKAKLANKRPGLGMLDYIQDGCIAALKAVQAKKATAEVKLAIRAAMELSN